ncbi:hypothetical protein BDQ17DRAFT_337211 [Cyathus striatus]|nr:hypothetical protein BDQ17DRAFT_337211 [Cyathus striatus]
MISISFQGLSLFLPTVITTLGTFSTVKSQLRTIPVYLAGTVWVLTVSYSSLRIRNRTIPILVSLLYIVIRYAIAIGTKELHAWYVLPSIATFFFFFLHNLLIRDKVMRRVFCSLPQALESPTGPLVRSSLISYNQ